MVTNLRGLAERLQNVEGRLNPSCKKLEDPWFLVWLGKVGACFALAAAEDLLAEKRDDDKKCKEARQILQAIIRNKTPKVTDKANWYLGHCLNSAEARISWEFHRLLKAYVLTRSVGRYGKDNDKDAFMLLDQVLRAGSSQEADFILRKFNSYRPGRDRVCNDTGNGAALRRVWARVTSMKHGLEHRSQLQVDSKQRWQDAHIALSELAVVFEEFAHKKGVIS